MEDWRGNKYKEEKLWYLKKHEKDNVVRVPKSCDDCLEEQAVRNCCIAEGDVGRTHWHGSVHTFDGHIKALCRKCWEKDCKKFEKRRAKALPSFRNL